MKRFAAGAFCALALCSPAHAQEQEFERTLQQIQRDTQERTQKQLPAGDRALIDYGGYLTLGYLSFDDSNHDNHGLREYELVGYGRVNFDGAHEFYARGRADYRDYNSGDSFENQPSTLMGRVEEGWYRFDLQRYEAAYQGRTIQGDVTIKAGRQFVDWGNGLTLNQYADGISAEVQGGPVVLDVLAAVTVKETIDFDTSRPDFDHNTHRGFYGARLTVPVGRHNPYAYVLFQRDYNRPEQLDAHVIPTRYDYNSYYAGVGSNGALSDNLAYGAEFCYEGGRTLSNSFDAASLQPVNQSDNRIEAYAADLRFDYLPNDRRRTRFTLEGIIASGDTDRVNNSSTFGGDSPHSVDRGFNSLGVLYAGLAFTPSVSNLMVLRAGASTYPMPEGRLLRGLQVGTDVFVFGKTNRDAPIDEPTGNSRYLGTEPDVFVNWAITEDVTLAVRYGIFFPGQAIPSGNQDHIRQFFYAAVTYAF
ncbi:MAG: hypothetical protein JWM97_571 [Phycisphaerales bacterium]|nr:hypothetical protein [Phycisphaerales bacterium]